MTGEDDDLGDTSHYEKPLVVVEVKASPAKPAPAPVLSKSLALELSKSKYLSVLIFDF